MTDCNSNAMSTSCLVMASIDGCSCRIVTKKIASAPPAARLGGLHREKAAYPRTFSAGGVGPQAPCENRA